MDSERSFLMPLDRCFIEHCSPTLANLKTASLFSCSYTSEQDLLQLTHGWSTAFQPKGVLVRVLRMKAGKALIYVYRPERLSRDLRRPGVKEFLTSCGYTSISLEYALERLSARLSCNDEFPHEIGLFLDYPLGDVQGFIQNGGANYKCSGCWKVYCNECETEKRFQKFQKCRGVYLRLFGCGRSVLQMTVAA